MLLGYQRSKSTPKSIHTVPHMEAVANSRTPGNPLTPDTHPADVGILGPGINWASVLPSSGYQVLPSCQGLRDQPGVSLEPAAQEQLARQLPLAPLHREQELFPLPLRSKQYRSRRENLSSPVLP